MGPELISVVVPVYNEASGLRANLAVILGWVERAAPEREIVLVDDGSVDGTWQVCRELAREFPEVRAFRFTRNFGKEAAILCGLAQARGAAAITLDSDLQHPPDLIPEMVRLWREEGCDIVQARKASRGGEAFYRRWSARVFYGAMRLLSGFDLAGASDYKLLSRNAISVYLDLPEVNRFFRGLTTWTGLRQATIAFDVPPGKGRPSRWSVKGLLATFLGAITAFSYVPLRLVTFAGLLTLVFSLLLILQTIWMKVTGRAVEGFATVIVAVLLVGSVIMVSLGIIGEYLAKIYEELKRRPNYLVAERTEAIEETA